MNLLQLRQECGRLLNDPNHERWSADTLNTRLNESQKHILGRSHAIIVSEGFTLTESSNTFVMTSTAATVQELVRIQIVRQNGDIFPLQGYVREQVDLKFPNWENWSDGEPVIWWPNMSQNQIYVAPAPDAANVITQGLRIWYVPICTNMAENTDTPFTVPGFGTVGPTTEPYHMALVHYAVAYCWMDDATPESLGKSQFHMSGDYDNPGKFEQIVKAMTEKFNAPEGSDNTNIIWRPQGGRVGSWTPSKSYPLGYGWPW